jgi:hypothetical protein
MVRYILLGLVAVVVIRLVARLVRRIFFRSALHGHRGFGFRRRYLSRLFRKLDATPAQERHIRDELLRVEAAAAELRQQRGSVLGELSVAIGREPFELAPTRQALRAAFDRFEDASQQAIVGIVSVLDARQRETLAHMLARRAGTPKSGGGTRGPYRTFAL